jgi:hypothetical protein
LTRCICVLFFFINYARTCTHAKNAYKGTKKNRHLQIFARFFYKIRTTAPPQPTLSPASATFPTLPRHSPLTPFPFHFQPVFEPLSNPYQRITAT